MLKGTKFYSIARGKCPRCMNGDIYPVNNPYRLKNLTDLNPRCTHCKQNFEPEPNFYYGAMYVSYAYTVALFVAVYVFFWDPVGLEHVALYCCFGYSFSGTCTCDF